MTGPTAWDLRLAATLLLGLPAGRRKSQGKPKRGPRRRRRPRAPLTAGLMVCNIGRGADAGLVARTLRDVEAVARREHLIVCFAELDEDDGPDEHHLLRQAFGNQWILLFRASREPVAVLADDWRPAGKQRSLAAFAGLVRYSPDRRVHVVKVRSVATGDVLTVPAGHYTTGARNSTPGSVPRALLAKLIGGWERMARIHRRVLRRAHRRGADSAWAMDVNNRTMPAMHAAEVRGISDPPDYVRFVPGRGRQVQVVKTGRVAMHIDSHDAPWARARFSDQSSKTDRKPRRGRKKARR